MPNTLSVSSLAAAVTRILPILDSVYVSAQTEMVVKIDSLTAHYLTHWGEIPNLVNREEPDGIDCQSWSNPVSRTNDMFYSS